MVSFDIKSLFTNVPLSETIKLCENLIDKSNLNWPEYITIEAFKELHNFATTLDKSYWSINETLVKTSI